MIVSSCDDQLPASCSVTDGRVFNYYPMGGEFHQSVLSSTESFEMWLVNDSVTAAVLWLLWLTG